MQNTNKLPLGKELAFAKIQNTKGRIFGATFIKRSDGSVRKGSFRLGVRKYLSGGELKYNPKDYDLISVFDMNKRGYRMIPLDAVMELK